MNEKTEMGQLRRIQLEELEIAKKYVAFCEKHSLKYFIIGGTLLGAVRHHGFIPWDDDMDFAMYREDFDHFLRLQKKFPNDLELHSYQNETHFYRIFVKVSDSTSKVKLFFDSKITPTCSPWIDVYPLDGLPNSRILRNIYKNYLLWRRATVRYSIFSKLATLDTPGRPILERMMIAFGKIFPMEKIFQVCKELNKLDRAAKRFSENRSAYLINIESAYKLKELFPKQVFGEGKTYEFEGQNWKGPDDAVFYLTQVYGNYNILPSIEERNHHRFKKIEIGK